MPERGEIPGGVLLREQQPRFSAETVMLASGEAEEIWIPLALLSEIEADLAVIRRTYPQLASFEIMTLPADVLYVKLKPGAPFVDAWDAGRLETGEAELDAALRHFNAVGVRRSYGSTFEISLAQSLNLDRLGTLVMATSTTIELATGDSDLGHGKQIKRSKAADARSYTFTAGCDSPAGCTNRQTWVVRLAADGALTIRDTVTP